MAATWRLFVSLAVASFRGHRPSVFRVFPGANVNHRLSSRSRFRRRQDKQIRRISRANARFIKCALKQRSYSMAAVFPDEACRNRNVRNLVDAIIFPITQSSRNRRPDNYAINQLINRLPRERACHDVVDCHYASSISSPRSRSSQLVRWQEFYCQRPGDNELHGIFESRAQASL